MAKKTIVVAYKSAKGEFNGKKVQVQAGTVFVVKGSYEKAFWKNFLIVDEKCHDAERYPELVDYFRMVKEMTPKQTEFQLDEIFASLKEKEQERLSKRKEQKKAKKGAEEE